MKRGGGSAASRMSERGAGRISVLEGTRIGEGIGAVLSSGVGRSRQGHAEYRNANSRIVTRANVPPKPPARRIERMPAKDTATTGCMQEDETAGRFRRTLLS